MGPSRLAPPRSDSPAPRAPGRPPCATRSPSERASDEPSAAREASGRGADHGLSSAPHCRRSRTGGVSRPTGGAGGGESTECPGPSSIVRRQWPVSSCHSCAPPPVRGEGEAAVGCERTLPEVTCERLQTIPLTSSPSATRSCGPVDATRRQDLRTGATRCLGMPLGRRDPLAPVECGRRRRRSRLHK